MGRKDAEHEEGAPTSAALPLGQEQTRPMPGGHPYGIFWLLPAFNLGVLALELAYQVNNNCWSTGCAIFV